MPSFMKKIAVSLFSVLAVVVLSGCIQIQVIDRTPSAVEPPQDTSKRQVSEHDLAVLAVDFDPPLEYDKLVERKQQGEGVTLLVAVENTGANAEKAVVIQIELSKDQDQGAFLVQEGTIDAIAPGEIKILHFKDNDIPFSYEYHLAVQVKPVQGEQNLADNYKDYDLLITKP